MEKNRNLNGGLVFKAKLDDEVIQNNENNMKNISPYMSKDLIAAAGFNVETPIVNAIIRNLTGTLPTRKSDAEIIKCDICDCELSSSIVLSFHINGSRHKKRLKALEIIKQLRDLKDMRIHLGDINNPNAFRCEICSLTVNSAQQLEIHLSGAKHKKKVAKVPFSEPELIRSVKFSESNEYSDYSNSPPAKKRRKEEFVSCEICNIFLNSQIQYDQHLISKKHLNKVNMNHSNQSQSSFKSKSNQDLFLYSLKEKELN